MKPKSDYYRNSSRRNETEGVVPRRTTLGDAAIIKQAVPLHKTFGTTGIQSLPIKFQPYHQSKNTNVQHSKSRGGGDQTRSSSNHSGSDSSDLRSNSSSSELLDRRNDNANPRPPYHLDNSPLERRDDFCDDSTLSTNDTDATSSLDKSPLPWSREETEILVQQMEFITAKVCEDRGQFPKEAVSQHLRTLQALIEQDKQGNLQRKKGKHKKNLNQHLQLSRDDPLLRQLSVGLRQLQLVDLEKLSRLLEDIRKEEDNLMGKDVLLLSGPSGCGKTTTLHFFAGTEFEEVEIEGFFHLETRKCNDPKVARFETSCCRYGVTKCLQTAQVTVDGKKFWVCDMPGLDALGGVEEEIAHGLGTIRALQRARTVRPVLILCKDTLGHRFVNLDKTWAMITRQFFLGPDAGLRPFSYIFTKFDSKYRTRLCQQFSHFQEDIANDKYGTHPKKGAKKRDDARSRRSGWSSQEDEQVFQAFVDDIVRKTTPEAHVVLPMREKPQTLLRQLLRTSYPVSDPENFFAPLATEASLSKLQIQLELTVHELSVALLLERYDAALHTLQQLMTITMLIPEAEPYYNLGIRTALEHARHLFQSMSELFEKDDFATAVDRVQSLRKLAEAFPEAQEFTECGEELLWRSIVEAMESRNSKKSYAKLTQVSRLLKDFPEAQAGVQRGLELKEARIRQAVAAGDLTEAGGLLVQLKDLSSAFPQARPYMQNSCNVLQKEIMRNMDDPMRVNEARDQLTLLARIAPHVPEAAELGRLGLRQLFNTVEKKIDDNEYTVTVSVVKTLMELGNTFPDSNDCIDRGVQIIWNVFGLVLEDKHYIRAIGIAQIMHEMVEISPKALEYTTMANEILGDRLLRSIQDGNYSIAMKMLLHLTKLEHNFPETLKSECVARGLKKIKQVADKAIKDKEYAVMIEFFQDLMQLEQDIPEAGRYARSMLTMVEQDLEKSVRERNFGHAIELLLQYGELQGGKEADMKSFITKGQEIFQKAIRNAIVDVDVETHAALHLVEMLLMHEDNLPVAGECSRFGLRHFRDVMEESIDQHNYVAAADLWHKLYLLSLRYPKVKKTVQTGFLMLRDVLAASLTEQNYKTATFIIQHFGKVENELPEADKCAKQSLTVIKNALLSSIDQEGFSTAMDILHHLVLNSTDMPDAFKCAQFGINHLQRAVETKLMAKKDYRKALEMMDQSIRLSKHLPDALKCAQGGLKIILKATENAIEQGDYGLAAELMDSMEKLTDALPEAYLSTEFALQAAYNHLTWLREALKSVVDQLGPEVPENNFTAIVHHLKTLTQNLLKAETLRYACIKVHTDPTKLEDQLKSAEEYCSEQLRRLTEKVVSELLNIEINKNSSESLQRMKSCLLSTIIRLKVMDKQLHQCPGGDYVAAAYDEAIKDLYVLLDGVLQSSESREDLTDAMETLELQVSFLCHVIVGFTSCTLEITDSEHEKIAAFEARRARLMDKFEGQINNKKAILQNYGPLAVAEGKTKASFVFIQSLDVSVLEGPRKALLQLGKSQSLCQLLPSKPKSVEYAITVKRFDLSIVNLMEQAIAFLETEYQEVVKLQASVADVTMVEKMASALINDTKKVNTALGLVTTWSNEVEIRCRPYNLRLYKLKQSLTETVSRMEPRRSILSFSVSPTSSGSRSGGSLNPFQCFYSQSS
jgi:tetratricopeptide (TPR) repeat protein